MVKPNIIIFNFQTLYNIFHEISDNLTFKITNIISEKNFLNFLSKKNISNFLILTKIDNKNFFIKNNFEESKKIFYLSSLKNNQNLNNNIYVLKYPIELSILTEKINIQLIKQEYNFQSKIRVGNYYLNLNSRVISKNENNLKLTEKEMDIILFLNKNRLPQKISILQSRVWGYTANLETHTVETHIYRLRKKINKNFSDDEFIKSTDDGYLI